MTFFSFGRQVLHSMRQKREAVDDVFQDVAGVYDRMNDVMSLGLHRAWKQHFVRQMQYAMPKDRAIWHMDMSCGTGDILRLIRENIQSPDIIYSVGCDPSMPMLQQCVKRFSLSSPVMLTCAPAENVPFASNCFDLYTCAFGLRNMSDVDTALSETFRILKPGGRFYFMEFAVPTSPIFSGLYSIYKKAFIPLYAHVCSQQASEAYRYLVESIDMFYSQNTVCAMLRAAGFHEITHENILNGIVAIYAGFKP